MGRLEQNLTAHEIIGLDTTPFIYLWERHPRYFALSETLFRHLKKPDVQGVTSIITLIEAKGRDSVQQRSFTVLEPIQGPVAVLTGAGVSAESGVPTFRGEDGLRSTAPRLLSRHTPTKCCVAQPLRSCLAGGPPTSPIPPHVPPADQKATVACGQPTGLVG